MIREGSNTLRKLSILVTILFFGLITSLSFAVPSLPFNIVVKSGTTLPTTIRTGMTANAYYTVSNNTLSQRNNNFVKYLPPNVLQVTSGGTYGDTCGKTFNLAPTGQPGDSCTLQLTISNSVNGNDPNPHNHLFVCFPGGITCAGTLSVLNVNAVTLVSISIIPVSASLSAGSTLQYTAVGTFSDGSTIDITTSVSWTSSNTSVATIAASGIATGVDTGTTAITATSGVVSNPATLNVTNTQLTSITISPTGPTALPTGGTQNYTATGHYADGTTQDLTTTVSWSSSDTTIATIGASTGIATGLSVGTTNITATYGAFTSNTSVLNVNALLYAVNVGNNSISFCGVASDGSLSCGVNNSVTNPQQIAIHPSGTFAYVTDPTNNTVSLCTVDNTFGLKDCVATGDASWTSPNAIAVNKVNNSTNIYAYITADDGIWRCGVDPLTSALHGCTLTDGGVTIATGVSIHPTRSFIYVSKQAANLVYYCPVELTTGLLSPCVDSGPSFNNPVGLAINSAGTIIYVTNSTLTGPVDYCTLNANGTISGCSPTANPVLISIPRGIALNYSGTRAYFANGGTSTISYCDVQGNGSLQNCNAITDNFNQPYGLAIN